MIHTDEDDEFERIARENAMKSGQPYFFDGVYVSVSQRNQVIDEVAEWFETRYGAPYLAEIIRGMKK
jgi:hypothetical protein